MNTEKVNLYLKKLKRDGCALFSSELNPFWSKNHFSAILEKMRKSKTGELNPMFNK